MAEVRVSPDPFTMVEYDAAALGALAEAVAARVGIPAGVEIDVEVDEALPRPLIASYVDVVDGRISLWCSGGNFEHPQYPRRFDDTRAELSLAVDLLRGADRLSPAFAGAPRDSELSERQRAAWDASAEGRLSRLDFAIREPLARYHFRLAHGFSDGVDVVYERLWSSDDVTWSDLEAACADTEALDTRAKPKARPGGTRDSLRT